MNELGGLEQEHLTTQNNEAVYEDKKVLLEKSKEDDSMRSNSATPLSLNLDPAKDTKQKIPIKYIENKTRRHVTFAKRRHGIMKKAYELSVLTGANVLLLILSRSGLVYTFTTPKLESIVRDEDGKMLIRACLNSSDDDMALYEINKM